MATLNLPVAGDVIAARYRVDDTIGRGAMAIVYVATDVTDDRQVAIKVLDPKFGSDETLEQRFENEAELGKTLQHPNTIAIQDSGRLEDGLPFVVMELLTGQTLADGVEEGAFEPARVLRIGRQVLESLSEAHAYDIIHRDIKPNNIMIEDDGQGGDAVKVLDFGIAKVLDESRVAHSIKTRTGVKMGSPTYMAPERVRTQGQPLTPSSDVYSVAVVMAELLAGEPLYGELTPIQIFATQLEGLPVPLPEEVQGTRLGGLLAKATSIPPDARFQTAAEMIVAVDRLLRRPDRILEPTRDAVKAMTERYEPVAKQPSLPSWVLLTIVLQSVVIVGLLVALILT